MGYGCEDDEAAGLRLRLRLSLRRWEALLVRGRLLGMIDDEGVGEGFCSVQP
jgi:hypothetical protein